MAGSPSEDFGVGGSSNNGISGGHRSQSGEALAEWRSSEQVENGTPSTSPPYWDTDDDDIDCGPKPSELYGKFTWKIEHFSQISKRELRSNAFEVGGYKWYILIYPQGCDVCNHLSLFLCVANHDKLLPGWSHFAQFTIAVVNKDPKKSKYSDTLHRFWKKEHDWGWKKFMELSKVLDGFIVSDTLVIKAQVQVIREKLHRPFRCLDCQYRRELVRVYLTNVEQICRRFVDERRSKLEKLIKDEVRWSSFHEFWKEVRDSERQRMSKEKTDVILKVVVKHFFIEKEVTSTLVMDSLYSGLKALECQSKSKQRGANLLDAEETPDPVVCVEEDMFVLPGDVLSLLERASKEPLPPKDEKGPQNRTKDGNSGEDFNKDSIERDERRLTELGRRSVEIFVLTHIFSNKIEVAYQESVALKKQEELIREEEAWQAESEQKARRGAADKEKRAKKKQSKQKRSSRKAKDKGRDDKFDAEIQEKKHVEGLIGVETMDGFSGKQVLPVLEKSEVLDDISDMSINGDDTIEMRQPDIEDRDASPLNSDTDTSDVHPIGTTEVQLATEASSSGVCGLPVQNGRAGKKASSVLDDSSSTCSTDSVPSATTNGSKRESTRTHKNRISPNREKKHRAKDRHDQTVSASDTDNRLLEPVADVGRLHDASGTCRSTEPESEGDVLSMSDGKLRLGYQMDQKVEEIVAPKMKLIVSDPASKEFSPKKKAQASSPPSTPTRNVTYTVHAQSVVDAAAAAAEQVPGETSSRTIQETERRVPMNLSSQPPVISKLEIRQSNNQPKSTFTSNEKPTAHLASASGMSRPSSTPLIHSPRPSAPVVSMVQTSPLLLRSMSATGRLGIDSPVASHSYAPSYRNAIMGKTLGANPSVFSRPLSSSISPSQTYTQPMSTQLSSTMSSPHRSGGNDQNIAGSGFTFGSVTPEILQNRPQWLEYPQHDPSIFHHSSELNGIQNLDIYGSPSSASQTYFADELPASIRPGNASIRQALPDEFPHLDIINSLFDEDHISGRGSNSSSVLSSYNDHRHHPFNRQFSFPGEISSMSSEASSSNYCRFDQLDNYHDNGMHSPYGPAVGSYGGLRDSVQMVRQSAYGNGHIDSIAQNQWPYGSAVDISLLNLRNNEGDGGSSYSYQMPEYSSLVGGVNGYTPTYRPANGR